MENHSDVAGSASEAQNAVPLAAEGPGIDRVPPVAPPVAPPAAPAASTAPRTKRTSLQSAQHKLMVAENKVAELRKCHALAAEAAVAATVKKEIDRSNNKAQKLQAEVMKWDLHVEAARSAVEVLQAKAAAAEKAEQARKDASRERSDNMTIDGRQLLVRTRLSFEPQFTGKSNTNDSVWEHVKAKFEAGVRNGQAAESDIRQLGSLKSKYSHELGAFKQWVALRHMKCVSGTPAEAIGMPRPALPMPACALCTVAELLPLVACLHRGIGSTEELHHRHLLGVQHPKQARGFAALQHQRRQRGARRTSEPLH